MTNKSLRDYINLIETAEQGVAEVYTPAPAKPFRNPPGFNKQGTGTGNKLAQLNRKEWEEKKKKEQGVAEAVPAQASGVDPKIQFLQPTIQFAEKMGYRVTLNPQGRVVAKLVNKQIEHIVRIGFSRGRDPGTKLEADMSDNWDSQTYAWSAKELAQDFKEFYKDALRDSPTQGQQGVAEGKGLAKKVKIVKGPDAGKTGWIREVKHGAFKGAPKTYYIDLDDGGQANNLPATALRLVKEQGMAEDTGSWIVYDPETKQIKKRFKTHTAGKSYAKTHGLGFASSEFYFDRVKGQEAVAEAETDYSKRRQRERDVDAGKPVAKPRQSKQTDYQKRRAQQKREMELGENTNYWAKLQNERNTKLNSLVNELKESLKK